MAKLSDRELLEKFRDAPHVLEDDVLDHMPERMGKVDVAGIAREILQNCAAKYSQPEMWNYNDPQSVIDEQIDNAAEILRSHLEGKSE